MKKTSCSSRFPNPLSLTRLSRFKLFRALIALTLAASVTVSVQAGTATWDPDSGTTGAQDGPGIWDLSVANWWNGSTDNGWVNGDNAIIGANSGAAGTISITNAAGVTVANVNYNGAASGNYNVAGTTLIYTGNPTVTVANGVTATNTTILGGTGFTKAGGGTLVLNPPGNNTNVGPTIINSGTVTLANTTDNRIQLNGDVGINSGGLLNFLTSGTFPTISTIAINGGAMTNVAGAAKTLTVNRVVLDNNGILGATFAQASLVVSNFDFRGGLLAYPRFQAAATTNFTVKSTPGTVICQGGANNAGQQGFIVNLNAGTLIMDYLNPGLYGDNAVRARFISAGRLTLGGGTLLMRSQGGSGRTETPAGTSLNAGATTLQATNTGTASGITLNLAAITRAVGGTMDTSTGTPGGGTATAALNTSSANVNGILGGWATRSAADWATGGGIIAAYAAYTTATDPTTWVAANNVSLSGNPSANLDDVTINTLKLSAASTVTINATKTLTLAAGGLLVTGSGAATVTGGTLKGAANADLVVHQFGSADLTIASDLADNTSASSLTKSGAGKLIISGVNNLTGTNYLNGGAVEVDDLAKLASGPLIMNNGALRYTGSDATSSRSVTLNGVGGTFDVAGSTVLTQSGAINGSGGVNSPLGGFNLGDWGGLTKLGSGTLVLSANNVYNGPTVVSNGVLAVNGTHSLLGASGATNYLGGGAYTVYGGTLGGTGILAGPVTIKTSGTIAAGTSVGTLTLATNLTLENGSTSLFEVTNAPGTNDRIIVQGNVSVANGTIAINVQGTSLEPGTYTLIQYSGTLSGSFNPTVAIVGGSVNGSTVVDTGTAGQINLVVSPNVAITSQPADTIVSVGQDATLTVTATGTAPLTYQWYYYGDNTNNTPTSLTDATNASFTITNAQAINSGFYNVVVANGYNSVASRIATLIVGNVAPIIAGPTNTTVIAGNNVSFYVAVSIANPFPDLQWQTNGVDVPGATSTTLTLNNVPYALDGAIVSVIATNLAGSATNSATLTVIVTPAITPQPTNLTVNVGDPAAFVSGATGVPTPSLQWYKNGAVLPGETGGTLSIASAQGSDNGTYFLVASNAAGVATSTTVRLIVNSTTLATTALSPTNGASGIGYDTPLYVTFNSPVTRVNLGKVRIYNATNSLTPVDTIDMSSNSVAGTQPHTLFAGDAGQPFNYFPVIINGSSAAIYPHSGVMTSNQTYYVTVDGGVFADASGAYFAGITDTNAWRFTTKPTGPANSTNLIVAADGSGDFITVQGAVDSIPLGSTTYTVINIRDGNYVEIVNISGKHRVTFRGQSRAGTVVGYPNNNNINGTTHSRMAFKVNANDIAVENLTLVNTTAQGGSQAEALMIETGARRFILNNADVNSRQDTILANVNTSQGYFYNSIVRGNFDYVWGGGNIFFTNCEIQTITGASQNNLVATRTDNGATGNWPGFGGLFVSNGISFVKCQLTRSDLSITNVTLAGANGTPNGNAAFIFCSIDTNCYRTPPVAVLTTELIWEFGNSNLDNTAPATFGVMALTNNDPRLQAAQSSTTWLNGWLPQLAPNILSQPANQSVNGGQTAVFSVGATGIPDPSYQWLKDGTNLVGETGATLTINNANAADAGVYSVLVSNAAGSVTSSTATLTVGNTAPVFTPVSDQTVNVGVTVNVTNVATDPDVPPQTLTYSLLSGPGNAGFDTGTGVFTWRPEVTQADSTNIIVVVATDDGAPNLSGTNSFTVIVNPLTSPSVSTFSYAGGQFSLTVNGQVGPDYAVQVSTNLALGYWTTLFITNSPPSPFTFVDPAAGAEPMQFYRIKVGPPLP
jgi:autotransporter-associated beta strand protein